MHLSSAHQYLQAHGGL